MKKIFIVLLSIIAIFLIYFINTIVGNPVNKALATSYAKQFVATQFIDEDYTLKSVGFNYDTKMYDYIVTHGTNSSELSYTLIINSKISNRSVDLFQLHPSLLDEELSNQLSKEGQVHVKNIVHNILPDASVEYKVYVPKGSMKATSVWTPGFELDLNAAIFINETVNEWDKENEEIIKQDLIEAFQANGIHYSRISIRVTKESEKNGITMIKTIYKDVIYQQKELTE